jgi:hypothetical protein
MAVIYQIIRPFGNRFIAAITTCLCLAATAAFYYTFRQPIMAHTTSLLASAGMVLIYLWLLKRLSSQKDKRGPLRGAARIEFHRALVRHFGDHPTD